MNSVITVIAATLLLSSAAHAEAGKIYSYEIKHVSHYKEDPGFNKSSKLAAKFLEKNNLSKSCIDLRELGSGTGSSKDGYSVEATVGFITNTPLTPAQEAGLKKDMCKDKADKCTASISFKTEKAAELSIVAYTDLHDDEHGHNHFGNRPSVKGQLAPGKAIPQFSAACSTGEYSDSWNKNASTKESRAMLKDIGVDITQVRDFGIRTSGGERFWSFGFPDHSLDTTDKSSSTASEKSVQRSDR